MEMISSGLYGIFRQTRDRCFWEQLAQTPPALRFGAGEEISRACCPLSRVPLHRRDRIPRRPLNGVARIIGRRQLLRSSVDGAGISCEHQPPIRPVETIFTDIVRTAEPETFNRLIDIAARRLTTCGRSPAGSRDGSKRRFYSCPRLQRPLRQGLPVAGIPSLICASTAARNPIGRDTPADVLQLVRFAPPPPVIDFVAFPAMPRVRRLCADRCASGT